MNKIYFTSDLHLYHDREFIYKPRGFENIDKMSEQIIANLIADVGQDDMLYILGDVMLGNRDAEAIELMKMVPGHKHLILGNHDTPRRIELYKESNIFESIQYALPLKTNKWHFFLSHYPMLTMNNDSRPDVVSLYGHTHQNNNWIENWQGDTMYNVGVDAHDNHPVSLDKIINDIRKYKIAKERVYFV